MTDALANRVRSIDVTTSLVSTVIGSGVQGGAEGLGSNAEFGRPYHLAILSADASTGAVTLVLADYYNSLYRRVDVQIVPRCQPGYICGLGSPNLNGTSACPTGLENEYSLRLQFVKIVSMRNCLFQLTLMLIFFQDIIAQTTICLGLNRFHAALVSTTTRRDVRA